MTDFRNLDDVMADILSVTSQSSQMQFAGEQGLALSRALFEQIGSPASTQHIHIAATSGKGTYVYGLQAVLKAHDKTTISVVSPHVYSVLERVQINGAPIEVDYFIRLYSQLRSTLMAHKTKHGRLTYFEIFIAIALAAAKELQPDYTIFETGIGGMLDTTQAVQHDRAIAVLGDIGMDHQAILGDSLPEIAAQKAGIVRGKQHAIAVRHTSATINDAFSAAFNEAKNLSHEWVLSELASLDFDSSDVFANSTMNLIVATAQKLSVDDGWTLDEGAMKTGLLTVAIPGRVEVVNFHERTVIFDGAHNAQKLQHVLSKIRQKYGDADVAILWSQLAGNDRQDARDLILQEASEVYEFAIPQQYLGPRQSQQLSEDGAMRRIDIAQIKDRIKSSNPETVWLVTGSFYGLLPMKTALGINT